MNNDIRVVILAAGLGTRMRSNRAKVLHQAGGDTLLNHVIRAALQIAPPERIVAIVGYQAEQVRGSVKVAGVRFAEQREQRGTGHAMLCAREAAGSREGRLVILNGDGPLLSGATLQALTAVAAENSLGGALVTTVLANPTGYGRIVRDARGLVAAIIEQRDATDEQLQIREVNPGVYCFKAALFWEHIREIQANNPANEYYVTDMVEILGRHAHAIAPLLVSDETAAPLIACISAFVIRIARRKRA
jgi:bifunctional UDP-N-acetylglucosamine pyrophosphorylase / glucosamine-1-phosphate N-acetyltransferase